MVVKRKNPNTKLKKQGLVIERTFNAPITLVWKSITNKEDIKKWSFDIKEFKPEVGFEFHFDAEDNGVKWIHQCKIMAVIPQKKLAYTWRYEGYAGDTLVTFELFAEGNKTKLRLTHTGLETFPKIPALAKSSFLLGWSNIIGTNLKNYLESTATEDREIIILRVLNAPRELVWEVWTNPKHVVHWWGPKGFTTTIEKMDVKPNGIWKLVMHGPDGTDYPNKSMFTEVVKPERIVFSHGGGKKGGPGANFVSTWTFDALEENKTKLTIRMVFTTAIARDRVVKEYGAIEGGKQTLERLSEYLPKISSQKEFVISRVFHVPRVLVWKALTDPEHMKHWWGPKGFTVKVAKMDFREGGSYHYCMRSPDGHDMWGKFVYREIIKPEKIVFVNSFSDEKGGLTRHPMSPTWPLEMLSTFTFEEKDGKTTFTIRWIPFNATMEEYKTFDKGRAGMIQGWTGTLDQLDAFLKRDQHYDVADGKICYLEIPSVDIDSSAAFYKDVFNWSLRKRNDGSISFDDTLGAVSGTWVLGKKAHTDPGLIVHIMVDNAEKTIEKIIANGGNIVQSINKGLPEITARFSDPAGNVFGIYQHP